VDDAAVREDQTNPLSTEADCCTGVFGAATRTAAMAGVP